MAAKKRRRARRKAAQVKGMAQFGQGTRTAKMERHGAAPTATDAARPTDERMARGTWRIPQGMGKHEQPVIDTSADMIGWLHDAGRITAGQEQAARHWQSVRARYIQELPDVESYKSCIAGTVPGFDDGDGDPQAIAEYRQIERRLTRPQRLEVLHVCEDDQKPRRLDVLCAALDVIGGR